MFIFTFFVPFGFTFYIDNKIFQNYYDFTICLMAMKPAEEGTHGVSKEGLKGRQEAQQKKEGIRTPTKEKIKHEKKEAVSAACRKRKKKEKKKNGVMVSTLDSESGDPSSNLGGT